MPSSSRAHRAEGGGSDLPSRADDSPRRRPRLDSDPQTPSSRTPGPKRLKPDYSARQPVMSSKMKGKLPDFVDLTQQNAFRPGAGAKKLVIKNLRAPSNDDSQQRTEQYYTRAREDLSHALLATFENRHLGAPMERLYIGVENICRRGEAPSLYKMVQEMCDTHLRRTILQRIQEEGGATPIDMARSVLKQWEIWDRCIVRLCGSTGNGTPFVADSVDLDPVHLQLS